MVFYFILFGLQTACLLLQVLEEGGFFTTNHHELSISATEVNHQTKSDKNSAQNKHISEQLEEKLKIIQNENANQDSNSTDRYSVNKICANSHDSQHQPPSTADKLTIIREEMGFSVSEEDVLDSESLHDNRDTRLFIGSLLTRHICQLVCNAHAITEVQVHAVSSRCTHSVLKQRGCFDKKFNGIGNFQNALFKVVIPEEIYNDF